MKIDGECTHKKLLSLQYLATITDWKSEKYFFFRFLNETLDTKQLKPDLIRGIGIQLFPIILLYYKLKA